MPVSVVMPQLGESVVEGTITRWLVKEGDVVAKDQPIVEVATDKADTEVPSPTSGVVEKLLAPEGTTVPTNTPIAVIEVARAAADAVSPPPAVGVAATSGTAASSATAPSLTTPAGPARQSPAVRKAARELGVDVSKIAGTGEGGRVTRHDVLRAAPPVAAPSVAAPPVATSPVAVSPVATSPVATSPVAAGTAGAPVGSTASRTPTAASGAFRVPPYVEQAGDEIVPFNRRRRIIADHMVYSKHVAPHVMTLAEIDMHRTAKLREARKSAMKAEGVNLTYLAFVAAATARALRENPVLNARVLDDAYVKLRRIHLGIAVETPHGLVVPVVRDADELTIRGMARAIDAVAAKARDGELTADDLAGATFSISNPGLKGNFVGAAIISQPNVAILRIGELVKRAVVLEVDSQDTIAIHPVMFAALSYDHRIVDGVAANNFLHRVTEILEAGQFEL